MNISMKLVTIVAENILREQLLTLIKKHGATGWSVTAVEGEGSRGNRTSDFEGRNAKIETIVSTRAATAIMAEVAEHYFANWAIITYSADVEVLRGGKYLPCGDHTAPPP